ncbi:ORF-51 [Teiidae poxvirus 1]|nr:ORF-51 [Teiidae poxvirus 1]
MYKLYPKKLRKSIDSLLKAKLDYSLLSSKNVHLLIKYNIFTKLPDKYYDLAKTIDLNNITAFDYDAVKIEDLKKLISILPSIPEHLTELILYHKKHLMTDGNIVDKLIETNMIELSEISDIIDEEIKTAVEIAIINASLVLPGTFFSLTEIEYIYRCTNSHNIKQLYRKIDASLQSILHMEEHYSIPPMHSAFYRFYDVKAIIALIERYPEDDIIEYVNGSVKAQSLFLDSMINIVKSKLPKILTGLNRWIASQLPVDTLRSTFGLYFYVLFEWLDLPLYVDKYSFTELKDEEIKFICQYIEKYNSRSELFTNTFRWYLYYCDIMHPQKVFYDSNTKEEFKPIEESNPFKNITEEYIVSTVTKFRYNFAIGKNILEANTTDAIKVKTLRLAKKQTICLSNYDFLDLGFLYTLLLRFKYKVLEKTIRISRTYLLFNPRDYSDLGLLGLTGKLCTLASRGIIDFRFLVTDFLWSPIMHLLEEDCVIDFSRFMAAVINIKTDNLSYGRNLEHIENLNVYEVVDYRNIRLYGTLFIKKVIFANMIFEYLFVLLVIRHQQSRYNFKRFIELMIQECLKGFGLSNKLCKYIYVNELSICCELERLSKDHDIPVMTYGLVVKVLMLIFSSLNGINKHLFRIRRRKGKASLQKHY